MAIDTEHATHAPRFVTTTVEVEGREETKVVELPEHEPAPWGADAELARRRPARASASTRPRRSPGARATRRTLTRAGMLHAAILRSTIARGRVDARSRAGARPSTASSMSSPQRGSRRAAFDSPAARCSTRRSPTPASRSPRSAPRRWTRRGAASRRSSLGTSRSRTPVRSTAAIADGAPRRAPVVAATRLKRRRALAEPRWRIAGHRRARRRRARPRRGRRDR